jgi:hypothetical protein
MKKKEQAVAVIEAEAAKEPSKTPIEIDGRTWNLCFDFQELAKAEQHYLAEGRRFHLMFALPEFSLGALQVVTACAIRCHHPELTWEQAQALVTLQSASTIALAVAAALEAGAN